MPPPQQESGEGYPSRPIRVVLPENIAEYQMFMIPTPELPGTVHLTELDTVKRMGLKLSSDLTEDYIWQRSEFTLEIKSHDGLIYLHGSADYGDNIEDEWLIVYILRELTRTDPRLWARICDSDGEFLLTEAANVLPKWITPEVDRNRVWIHQGELFLLPPPAGEHPSGLALPDAIQAIRDSPSSLVRSPLVESEAFYRLGGYPEQIQEMIHHALLLVPRKLAHVLHERPRAVAPAVEAFYLREPSELRAISSPEYRLRFAPVDLVRTSVRFSRILFAQLRAQRFELPRNWGSAREINAACIKPEDGGDREAQLELGMKLAIGYELLARNAATSDSRVVREVAIILDDLEEDGAQALPTDEEMRSWKDANRRDDDSWLDVSYEDLDRTLQGRAANSGPGSGAESGFADSRARDNLQRIVSKFEEFLNDQGAGPEGAEMDEMDVDDDSSSASNSDGEDKEVSFDEEEFSRMMREMMGLPAADAPSQGQLSAPGGQAGHENVEDGEIRHLMDQMEAELKAHGALRLEECTERDPVAGADAGHEIGVGGSQEKDVSVASRHLDDGNDVDIDYNLAKNLLESFKSQAGLAGPAGNLLGMMGLGLPRDEDDKQDDESTGNQRAIS